MAEDNIQYKDRLFNFLFGSEENRAWTLSLYNAVNDSAYDDPSAIEITTIKEIMYLGMHNDVSFIISDEMNLYEQQSTYNPNMPLRMMQYAGNLFERYIKQHNLNKYGSSILQLPVPKLIVFYNGTLDQQDEMILQLSDSFSEGERSDIEVRVKMLNVNYGKNLKLMKDCKPLMEYSWLVAEVRKNNITNDTDGFSSAVDQAITAMPDEFLIKPFLILHRTEVKGMLLTEYNEAETMELFKIEGRKEGREEEKVSNIKTMMETLKLTAQQAMNALKISEADQKRYLPML
ncbi:MAG: hypothetical protein IJI57_03605 [Flexilinea sp.]|nr:hypothetical protein [Flexilinea sp.]